MQEFKRKTDTIRWVLTRLTSKRRRGMYGKMKDLFATRLVVIETSRLYMRQYGLNRLKQKKSVNIKYSRTDYKAL